MRASAAIAFEVGQPLVIRDVEVADDLAPHEILVRNVATGICHTDVTVRDAPAESRVGQKPIVLGHEGAGIVERVGAEVSTLAVGDHVVLTYYSDGSCAQCHQGREAYCESSFPANFAGTRLDGSHALTSLDGEPIAGSYHQQSSFSTYSIATDRNAIKAPDDLPLELLAPLGCGILTGGGAVRNRIRPRPGGSFAVFGMGALGFAALHMAKQAGCSPIIAIDLHESRLALATEFGATHTVTASRDGNSVAEVRKICPLGVDYSYEATGNVTVMEQAIRVLGGGGRCILSGAIIDPDARVRIAAPSFLRGIDIGGVLLGDGDPFATIGAFIDDVRDGAFPIDRLITVYDFDDINVAIDDALSGAVVKAVVRFPTD